MLHINISTCRAGDMIVQKSKSKKKKKGKINGEFSVLFIMYTHSHNKIKRLETNSIFHVFSSIFQCF